MNQVELIGTYGGDIWIAVLTWVCPLWPIASFEGWDSWYARVPESEQCEPAMQLVLRSVISLLWPLQVVLLLIQVMRG